MFYDYLFNSLLLICAASLFETLFSAYTYSEEAGIRRLIEKYPDAAKRLEYWQSRWEQLSAVLLTLAVVCKIASVVFASSAVFHELDLHPPIAYLSSIIYIFLFIVLLKIVPKVLSESYADRLSVSTLPLVAPLARILFFVSIPVAFLEKRLLHRAYNNSDDDHRPSTEDEILSLVDQTDDEDLEEEEREIIKSVFEFGEKVSREIMTPRVDIIGLEDDLSVSQCIEQIKDANFSRFPIFHETMDDIRGTIHVKELLRCLNDKKGNQNISTLLKKKATFVPESMPINDLLKLLQEQQTQMAVIVDEYGGTAGLVSIEDIVEELVGEIEDEFDEQDTKVQELADGSYLVDARLPVSELNDLLNINIPEQDEYDSAGGYIFHELGRIPNVGESISAQDCDLIIHNATPRQLIDLKIVLHNKGA